jgi:peptidoglycan hydrolase-like protein with peptidoglycan-binding domain
VGGVAGGAVGYGAAKSYDSGVRNSESPNTTSRSTLVQSAQQSLNEKGFDAGAPDGQWGPKTEDAVRNFQSANGLQLTGQLDSQTIAALGIAQPAVAR